MKALKQEESISTQDSLAQESPEKLSNNTTSKKFFKKVFETEKYNLYEILFKLHSKPFQNYLKYNDLRKGEKRVLEYFVEYDGVKNSTILPITNNREYTIGNNTPIFTPLSSGTIKNIRRKLKTMSKEKQAELAELAISIKEHGFEVPKHDIKLYNVDYKALQLAVNDVSQRVYTLEEIYVAIAVIGHFVRGGRLQIGKKVWGAIFTHADYKLIIEVLIELGILTKTDNAFKGWKPTTYSFNIYDSEKAYTVAENKALTRIKKAKITFAKNSLKEQLKMAKEAGQEGLVEDIKARLEGYKMLNSGRVPKEYGWMKYEGLFKSFGIHFQTQRAVAQKTGEYKSYWQVRNEVRLTDFITTLKEQGIDVLEVNLINTPPFKKKLINEGYYPIFLKV